MARKELIYQGLDRINVDIEDTSATSPNYFKVTELKPQFNAGINAFKFKANTSLFSEGARVYIEILDSNGEPVYNEVGLDLESKNQSIIISVYINQDVPPGPARIILCSTLNQSVNGNLLNTSRINLRWSTLIYIDPSLPNETEIVFNSLPVITVTATTASYNNYGYSGGSKIATAAVNATYNYSNNSPVLFTASNATIGFDSTSLSTTVQIAFTSMSLARPLPSGIVTVPTTGPQVYTSTITAFSGSGIAYLATPITFAIDNSKSRYQIAKAAVTASITYEQPLPLVYSETENTHNIATVFFSNLAPQLGTIAKIRAYTRSTGINEYILLNDLDITYLELEPGFTVNSATASFVLPTSHRNDRLDLKFEFINPSGIVSKQSIEVLNTLFLGGNTYIGGDDNLLTGSLFVASSTSTGVQITGKNSSAMIASIGYQGFDTAKANNGGQYAGFVLYSGSIQSILDSSESYSGVGLELIASSGSYFKYGTADGGRLEIKTKEFVFGNSASYLSSSAGNITIHSANFDLDRDGAVTASAVYVAKEVAGDGTQVMIDTENAILDATNLARSLYFNPAIYTSSLTGLGTSAFNPIGEVIFQGLKNETKYTISYQSFLRYLITAAPPGTAVSSIILTSRIYHTASGSAGDMTFYDTSWTLADTSTSLLSRPNSASAGYTSKTFSEDLAPYVTVSQAQSGKLLRITFSGSITNGCTVNSEGEIKNISVIGSRALASAWNVALTSVTRTPNQYTE